MTCTTRTSAGSTRWSGSARSPARWRPPCSTRSQWTWSPANAARPVRQRHVFRANGQTLLEPGFLAAYHEDHDEDETDVESEDEQRLPALEEGEQVALEVAAARAAFHAAAAALHRGEPRQVAREPRHRPPVDLCLDHRDAALPQVRRDARPRVPSRPTSARSSASSSSSTSSTYVDYGFTAAMEDVLDEISNGEKEWRPELATASGSRSEARRPHRQDRHAARKSPSRARSAAIR